MSVFYETVLGLEPVGAGDTASRCFDIGGVVLCLQTGSMTMRDDQSPGPRMVFYVQDVPQMREQLSEQGVRLGKMHSFGQIVSCDGVDPEGNPFRLSNQA